MQQEATGGLAYLVIFESYPVNDIRNLTSQHRYQCYHNLKLRIRYICAVNTPFETQSGRNRSV